MSSPRRSEGVYARTAKRTGETVYDIIFTIDGMKYKRRGFKTKREALAERRRLLAEGDRGSFVKPSKDTFGKFLRGWLDLTRPQNSSTATYRRVINRYVLHKDLVPQLANVPLQKLRAEDLEVLYRFLFEKGLSATTVRLTHTILKISLRVALERGYVSRNVAAQVRYLPPKAKREVRPYTPEEARAFLAAARDERMYAAWRLFFTIGPRRNEVLHLRWCDLDLETGGIVIRRGGESGSTKTGKARVWSLDAESVAILRAHKRAQAEERMAHGLGKATGDDYVFTRPDGRPLSSRDIHAAQVEIEKRAGLPHRRIHDMRHTAATFALSAGVDVKRVQAMLGHANAGFTLDLYAHLLPGGEAEAAARVASVLDGSR